MYLSEIIDKIGDAVNDTTLKYNGVNSNRTKSWVQQYYFLDLIPRVDWKFTRKQDTFTTTSGTQRYNLPRWIDNPSRIESIIHPTSMDKLPQSILEDVTGKYDLTVYYDPTTYVIGPRTRTNYTTGTVTATSSTKTITGSGTSWESSNIAQFDYIQLGNYVYTVNSVDSNTQITIFESLLESVATSTYIAVLDRWTVDLFPVPNATLNMIIYGKQLAPRLDDAFDIPILPDNYHWILVKAGVVKALQHNQEDYSAKHRSLRPQ